MIKHTFVTLLLVVICANVANAQWSLSGDKVYNTNTGNIGIGTTSPDKKLTIDGGLGFFRNTYNPTTVSAGYMHYNGTHLTLGINSNDPTNGIRFETTSSKLARLIIRNDGNIGIGDENPTEKLSVDGLIKIPLANNERHNSPGLVGLSNDDFLHTSSQQYLNNYGFGFFNYLNGNPERHAYMSGFFGLHFFTEAKSRMTISRLGNIGIGDETPSEKLSVDGLIKIPLANNERHNSPGLVGLSNDDFLHTSSQQYLNNYGFGFFNYLNGNPERHAYMSGFFGLHFFTEAKSRMLINRNGQVGIGVTNFGTDNTFKLFVKGGIRTEKAKIDVASQSSWGDYVFEPTYRLAPLNEIETYIKAHKHLPGVPSAATLVKKGLDLGKMHKIQMVKIEELTLHTISQEKKIKQKDVEIQQLKDQNKKMQRQMAQVLKRLEILEKNNK